MWEDIGECGRTKESVGGHRLMLEDIGKCGKS